ncbi:MAG: hypothetical protein Q7R73_01460 [bacterium]|nr:hypothetical protein [bacterium]
MAESKKSAQAKSAQDFINIDSIRDGVVVMKDSGIRAVLMASSLNFALKSEDEQDAITFQYQNFLNSLDFSIQFVTHSRKLNIVPYLDTLKDRVKEEPNELLKIQIEEYVDFVKSFVELSNIVAKTFYVIVPFNPSVITRKGLMGSLTSFLKPPSASQKKTNEQDQFAEFKAQLFQRVDEVSLGLVRIGVRTAPLNTEELIELFYGLYNPTEQAAREK